jgi:hypothetical protein
VRVDLVALTDPIEDAREKSAPITDAATTPLSHASPTRRISAFCARRVGA